MTSIRRQLFTILFIGLTSCTDFKKEIDEIPSGTFTTEIRKFSTCSELQKSFDDGKSFYGLINSMLESEPTSVTTDIYDTQSESVSESDKVQISNDYLFVLRSQGLEILSRKTFHSVKTISLDKSTSSTLLIDGDYAILISSINFNYSRVQILNLKNLSFEKQFNISGAYQEARIHDHQLILVTQTYTGQVGTREALTDDGGVLSPKCSDVFQPQINAYNSTLTMIYNFSTNQLSQAPKMSGFIGNSNVLYMTANSLYLLTNSFYTFPSHLRKINWNRNSVELKSVVTYPGIVKDRWALNEYADPSGIELTIATSIDEAALTTDDGSTDSILPGRRFQASRLISYREFNDELFPLSQSLDFGLGENIQSVRYVDNLAYIVTFRNTDPLFIFDLSDREHILQLGEIKVPGFSTHLRPLSATELLGVGFNSTDNLATNRQLQISLFDVSKKEAPMRSQVFNIGQQGSSSEATQDAHALFYDRKTGLIALPITEVILDNTKYQYGYETVINFTGAQVYQLKNGKMTEHGRITHSEWRKDLNCEVYPYYPATNDIQRVLMIDNQLVSVSLYGVMVHDQITLEPTFKQEFNLSSKDCPAYRGYSSQ